jgi:hypothetical protein
MSSLMSDESNRLCQNLFASIENDGKFLTQCEAVEKASLIAFRATPPLSS